MKEAVYSGAHFSYTEHELVGWKAHILHEYGHIWVAILLHWRAGNPMQPETLQILTGSLSQNVDSDLMFVHHLSQKTSLKDFVMQQSKLLLGICETLPIRQEVHR